MSSSRFLPANPAALPPTTLLTFYLPAGTSIANIPNRPKYTSGASPEEPGSNQDQLIYISLSFGFSLIVNVWVFFPFPVVSSTPPSLLDSSSSEDFPERGPSLSSSRRFLPVWLPLLQ